MGSVLILSSPPVFSSFRNLRCLTQPCAGGRRGRSLFCTHPNIRNCEPCRDLTGSDAPNHLKLPPQYLAVLARRKYIGRRKVCPVTSLDFGRSQESPYDLGLIKNRSRKQSPKLDDIGVGRIRTFPFLPTSFATPSLMIQ